MIALLLVGCGASQATPQPAPASAGRTAPSTCADRVARLEQQLQQLVATTPGFLPLVQGIRAPVARTGSPLEQRGFVIAVQRDGSMFVQGYRLASAAEAWEYLDDAHKRVLDKVVMEGGGSAADAVVPLYIWADRDTPVGVIADLVAAAAVKGPRPDALKSRPSPPGTSKATARTPEQQQAIDQARAAGILGPAPTASRTPFVVRLLVASEEPPAIASTPAVASTVAAKLPPSEPGASRYLVEQLRGAVGACSPLITALATSSLEVVPAREAAKLVEDVPAGLQHCACKVANLDVLEWGLRTWFSAWAPRLKSVALPALPAGSQAPIATLLN